MNTHFKKVLRQFTKKTGIPSPYDKSDLPILDRILAVGEWLDHKNKGEHGKIDDDMVILNEQRKSDKKKSLKNTEIY